MAKCKYLEHSVRKDGILTRELIGKIKGRRRQRRQWLDDINGWTGLTLRELANARGTENLEKNRVGDVEHLLLECPAWLISPRTGEARGDKKKKNRVPIAYCRWMVIMKISDTAIRAGLSLCDFNQLDGG